MSSAWATGGKPLRVAIVYPPLESAKGVALLTQNRQFQWFSRPTYIFPVVPATAATMLHEAGHEVFFLDAIAREMSVDDFERELIAFEPDLVVMETKTPVVKRHWRWVSRMREILPFFPRTVLVGDHVTALPEETMENSPVDFILTGGDWDFLLKNLVDAAFDPKGFEAGIWYRAGGKVENTGAFRLDHDLNSAPWIDRDLVDWKLYARRNGNFKRTPGTYIMSGRDCWHAKCTFCSWTTLYPTYRTRDAFDVVDEIEMLVSRYGVKEIMDDSGTLPVGKWLYDFCHEMIRRGLDRRVRIDCNMRFGRLGLEEYRLMRRAGFRLVLFGVESANQETLDRFSKALKVEDIEEGARLATKASLAVHLTFMFGHRWEGPEEIANTVRFARRLLAKGHAATLQCTLTVPYPGTPLFRELKETGGLSTLDWDEYDQRTAVTRTEKVSEDDIKKAIRDVYGAFLQPMALWHVFRRNLFDISFYWRGFKYLRGHLLDFSGKAE